MVARIITAALFTVAALGLLYVGSTYWSKHQDETPGGGIAASDRGGLVLVTVDVARIFNAQRAAAGGLFKGDPDAATTLAQIGHLAEDTIRSVAGPNAVILIKQAVVNPSEGLTPDITDTVLERLGLPKTAQTIDPLNKGYSYGGTNVSESNLGDVLDGPAKARVEAVIREREAKAERAQSELVP